MDLNKLKAKLEALNNQDNNGGGSKYADKFWKPEIGKHQVRIVPSAYDQDNPFTELLFHTTKGMCQYPILALSNFGQQDPVEDFIKELRQTSDRDNWSLSGKISPKVRYFCPVIVRGEEDKGVRLWNVGPAIYKALLQLATDDEIGDFTDVVSGTDLVVEKVKAEPYPETTVRARRNSSPLSTDPKQVEAWLAAENQPKAIDCFRHFDYDYIKKLLEAYLTGKPVQPAALKTEEAPVPTKPVEPAPAPEAPAPEVKEEVKEPVKYNLDSRKKTGNTVTKKFDDLFGGGEEDDLPF